MENVLQVLAMMLTIVMANAGHIADLTQVEGYITFCASVYFLGIQLLLAMYSCKREIK